MSVSIRRGTLDRPCCLQLCPAGERPDMRTAFWARRADWDRDPPHGAYGSDAVEASGSTGRLQQSPDERVEHDVHLGPGRVRVRRASDVERRAIEPTERHIGECIDGDPTKSGRSQKGIQDVTQHRQLEGVDADLHHLRLQDRDTVEYDDATKGRLQARVEECREPGAYRIPR